MTENASKKSQPILLPHSQTAIYLIKSQKLILSPQGA